MTRDRRREPGDESDTNLPALPDEQPTRECSACGKRRPLEVAGVPATFPCPTCGCVSAWFCHRCGERSTGTVRGEDGISLCPSCRLTAAKMTMSQRTDHCAAEGCTNTVGEHIGEFQRLVGLLGARMQNQGEMPEEWRSRPTVLERLGVHPPRNAAVAARLGRSVDSRMTVEQLRAAELAEDRDKRLAEAERQMIALREWAKRTGTPWSPNTP